MESTASQDDLKISLERQLTGLQSESKQARKEALHRLNHEIFESPSHSDADLAFVFNTFYVHILKGLSDESEACREKAAEIVANFIEKLPLNDYYLTYILPVIVRRIGGSSIVEESEELRLLLVSLVSKIIHKYKNSAYLVPFFNDFTAILTRTVADSYPKVKIEACETIVLLTEVLKRDFHMQSESFILPILKNFTHQHYKVREAAVRCIGTVVMNGTAKAFEMSVTPMAERLFDENVNVRHQVTIEVGNWMLHLRDRYSYWHKVLPLLLTSLSDAMESVRTAAFQLWEDVGHQYMEENEEDLKKKTDFLTENPTHYPPDIGRPNLGCRTLVQRNIGKIVPAIAREMEGWQADARLRVAQLLCWLILCSEEGCTQHANTIVHTMIRGARDEDPRVVIEVKRAAELFGYFVTPSTWWPLISPELELWGALLVLSNIIKGTEPSQLTVEHLQEICKELAHKEHCQTRKEKYQINLLNTVSNIMDCCAEGIAPVTNELFVAVFNVYSIAEKTDVCHQAQAVLKKLNSIEKSGPTLEHLYEKHLGSVLSDVVSDAVSWVMATPDRCVLECALNNAGWALGNQLHLVAPLLKDCLTTPKVDPEVKLKMFTSLSKLMLAKKTTFKNCEQDKLKAFLNIVLQEIIVSNLVWTPGRTAEAIRTSAICCLCSVLQGTAPNCNSSSEESIHETDLTLVRLIQWQVTSLIWPPSSATQFEAVELFPNDTLERFLESIIPLVTALVDDNSASTRQYSLKAICYIANVANAKNCFNTEMLHKMYFVVLKRLDDSNDKVRSMAVYTLRSLFKLRPSDYDAQTNGAHVDALYSALLVHLDDLDEGFRKQMEDALFELSCVDPNVLMKKLKANIQLYRNKLAYEKLMEHVQRIELKK